MKKPMLALLAVLACMAVTSQGVRADDAKDDGPDMKETLKSLKRYLNEDAGVTWSYKGENYYEKYVFGDTPWTSPAEVAISYELQQADRSVTNPPAAFRHSYQLSFKLKDLDPEKIEVALVPIGLILDIRDPHDLDVYAYGVRLMNEYHPSLVTYKYKATWEKNGEGEFAHNGTMIYFKTKELANKACDAFRRAALLAGARAEPAEAQQIAKEKDAPSSKSPAGGKDDGPDMKETLNWIKQYFDKEAGATSPRYAGEAVIYTFEFVEVPWKSPEDVTISYKFRSYCKRTKPCGLERLTLVSFKLKDLDPDKFQVSPKADDPYFVLELGTAGGEKGITCKPLDNNTGKDVVDNKATIFFNSEESANKACRAFRRAALLAGAKGHDDPKVAVDPFALDPKSPPVRASGAPASNKPSDKEFQRRDVEKQIAALEADLPAARREDADYREENRRKRADAEGRVKELDDKANSLLKDGKLAEAAVVIQLSVTAKQVLTDPSNFKDEKREDRLLKEIADLKQKLIDLRD